MNSVSIPFVVDNIVYDCTKLEIPIAAAMLVCNNLSSCTFAVLLVEKDNTVLHSPST